MAAASRPWRWPLPVSAFFFASLREAAFVEIVDNFSARHFRPPNTPKMTLRQAKTALALAPEGVEGQNVKMGMTKCAPF